MNRPKRIEHHILEEIFSIVVIPAVFERQDVEAAMVMRRECAKCLGVSTLGSSNELSLCGR